MRHIWMSLIIALAFMPIFGSCGPTQPDPTAGPITYKLDEEGSLFSDQALIHIAKNCFERDESITVNITLQAGTVDLESDQLTFTVKGPFRATVQQQIVWKSPDPIIPQPSKPALLHFEWTLPALEPGIYTLSYEYIYPSQQRSTSPLPISFGVTYIENFYDLKIPCSQLEAE